MSSCCCSVNSFCKALRAFDVEPLSGVDFGSVSGADVGPMAGHDAECDLHKNKGFR